MTTATFSATPVAEDGTDVFALDVHVVIDVTPGETAAPCSTDDGCDPTCASSCTSGS